MSCKLSVNINKFALIRNSRGENNPNLIRISTQCLELGVAGITVHPRPDERHIRYADLQPLKELVSNYPEAEFNIEGYPSKQFLSMIDTVRPHQVTLVPDPPEALTSSFGWNLTEHKAWLTELCHQFRTINVRSSLFVDPEPKNIEALIQIAPNRVELYTYDYAHQFPSSPKIAISPYIKTAQAVSELGIDLNAGHDLNQENLNYFLTHIPQIKEVSIGHALVCDALQDGLTATLNNYLKISNASSTHI